MTHTGNVKKLLYNIVANYFSFLDLLSMIYIAMGPILGIPDIIIGFEWDDCQLEQMYINGIIAIGIINIGICIIGKILMDEDNIIPIQKTYKQYIIVGVSIFGIVIIFIISLISTIKLFKDDVKVENCNINHFDYMYARYLLNVFTIAYVAISLILLSQNQINSNNNDNNNNINNRNNHHTVIENCPTRQSYV